MFTGIHKLTIVGTIVAALVLAAPAFGVQLPDGYELPSARESSGYSPQALQAMNERWEATARFHEQSTGYSPQALQALNGRWQAMARFYEQSTGYSPQALQAMNERWEATARFHEQSTGYSPQALQALGERGEAMGRHYGQASTSISSRPQLDVIERAVVARQVDPGSGRDPCDHDSFSWDGVGIVAGSALLLAALAGAALLGIRTRGRVAHP